MYIFRTSFFLVAASIMMIGATAIGMQQQSTTAAAQPSTLVPPSCPPNTQSFEQGFCVGPEPTLTYLCDTEPAGLQLVGGGESGPECVLIDNEGNILYTEPAILADIECSGQFPILEGIERCLARPGNQQNRGP